MDKLSELSKPVAYKFDHGVMGPGDFKYGTPQMHSTAKDENASPLYSQEYVSALLAENERVASDLVARNGEIEGMKKRASELEAHNARLREWNAGLAQESCELQAKQEAVKSDASQVFKEIGNELGCNPDNESIMAAIDELKERLATPVRLPTALFCPEEYVGSLLWSETEAYNKAISKCVEGIHAAGFTVEGDE
ncbi:hypothetical protein [Serratia marcescens]|uniref:hypothetical protein n=1 Tax=Serratia marcescens TaxID=615 RepID=UPI000B5EAB07|nr:hypothetical protein [Serratia marcescens]ASM13345.1 hypothetical protein BVG93_15935 [Serratia marcescens]